MIANESLHIEPLTQRERQMAYAVSRGGWNVVEAPISFVDRVRGTSKMSSHIVVEALVLVTWWALRDRVLRRGR